MCPVFLLQRQIEDYNQWQRNKYSKNVSLRSTTFETIFLGTCDIVCLTHHFRILCVSLIPLAKCEVFVIKDGRAAPLVDPAHQLPTFAASVLDHGAEGGLAGRGRVPIIRSAIGAW